MWSEALLILPLNLGRFFDAAGVQQVAMCLVNDIGERPSLDCLEPVVRTIIWLQVQERIIHEIICCLRAGHPGFSQHFGRIGNRGLVCRNGCGGEIVAPGHQVIGPLVEIAAIQADSFAKSQVDIRALRPVDQAVYIVPGRGDRSVVALIECLQHVRRRGEFVGVELKIGQRHLHNPVASRRAVGCRKLRVLRPRLLEILVGLRHQPRIIFHERPCPQTCAVNVGLVGSHRTRANSHHVGQGIWIHGGFECLGDLDREIFLDLYDVGRVPVVVLRPEVETIGRSNQLGRHANTVARTPHRAFQNVCNAKLAGDCRNVLVGALVRER